MSTRFAAITDISGRVTENTLGNEWVTAAAVVIASGRLDAARAAVPVDIPKWRNCQLRDAEGVVELMKVHCASVGIVRVNKDTRKWRQCWNDERPLQAAVVAESGCRAGFISPANVLTFFLFGQAFAIGIGNAMKTGRVGGILDREGHTLVEGSVICDSDVKGEENTELFKSLFGWHANRSRLLDIGYRPLAGEIHVTTEQQEPLLYLADYAAGMAQVAGLSDSGRAKIPVSPGSARQLVEMLEERNMLGTHSMDFTFSYDEIFGVVVERARALEHR